MNPQHRAVPHGDRIEEESREQEVLRANKELAAYFKGKRTEREARAALKIVKAFLRHRERLDPAHRRPLPGIAAPNRPATVRTSPKTGRSSKVRRRPPRLRQPKTSSDAAGHEIKTQEGDE